MSASNRWRRELPNPASQHLATRLTHNEPEFGIVNPTLAVLTRKSRQHQELLDLETALADPEIRRSGEQLLEEMFHPDYMELGSSGRIYDRQTIVDMMSQEDSAGVVIRDFNTAIISEGTALVTYRSIGQSGEEARRSSIWVNSGERWLIRFHQGTRVPNRWGGVS